MPIRISMIGLGSMMEKAIPYFDNNISKSKYIFGKWQDDKWTLESKSEYIVENNIHHLFIFQKCICFNQYYLKSKFMPESIFSKYLKLFHLFMNDL